MAKCSPVRRSRRSGPCGSRFSPRSETSGVTTKSWKRYDGNPTRYGPLDQGVAYHVPPNPASINDNSGLATVIFEVYRWWSPSSGWTDWYWSWASNVYDETLRTYNGQCFNPGTTF